jgi:hypothetical protein
MPATFGPLGGSQQLQNAQGFRTGHGCPGGGDRLDEVTSGGIELVSPPEIGTPTACLMRR